MISPFIQDSHPERAITTLLAITEIPVILYNNPSIQKKQNIPLDIIRGLQNNPRVIGIKDTSRDPAYFGQLLALRLDRFRIFQGSLTLALESLQAGASGVISSVANLYPRAITDLCREQSDEANQIAQLLREDHTEVADIKKHLYEWLIIKSPDIFTK